MAVYLDVIWALNLLFDCLLLSLAAIMLKRAVPPWRIAAGGFIGSLIILLHFTPLGFYSGHPLSKLLFSVLMVLSSFGFKGVKFFFSALAALYLSTFLIGGALFGAHYFLQTGGASSRAFLASISPGFGDPVSWAFVLIGFPLAWHFSKNRLGALEMAKIKYAQLVKVQIAINGESFSFTGLVDSGNQLYDPLSRLPVMFASVKKCIAALPPALQAASTEPEAVMQGGNLLDADWAHRIRIVPYSVIGQENKLVLAIKPDMVEITQGGQTFRTNKALVSFTLQELSSDGSFECIVHPKMLTGAPGGPGMAS
ncbi:sigma-E processing peptidase SpoIIGA [Neobacillus piezotolerans]|uniref:Sigma-E processing peptidase SpoIIGA n=1 Tax=Neobacillus piezotolerans TaxID=2259171 RepID=A0A3D8GVJ0_9BACI|nr:sigma-E processing peptidase SpoIIGA [Neobacillus piezotolerans]RDU38493.1 sigma-E processing peptidase SpoIIGA [Neobacillus piezotolerans]